jgi:acyl carrier protein
MNPRDDPGAAIREFVGTELLSLADGSTVTEHTRLLRGGVDSMGIMELIVFLQERLGLRFTEADASPENFRTVGGVERLVARKLADADADADADAGQAGRRQARSSR